METFFPLCPLPSFFFSVLRAFFLLSWEYPPVNLLFPVWALRLVSFSLGPPPELLSGLTHFWLVLTNQNVWGQTLASSPGECRPLPLPPLKDALRTLTCRRVSHGGLSQGLVLFFSGCRLTIRPDPFFFVFRANRFLNSPPPLFLVCLLFFPPEFFQAFSSSPTNFLPPFSKGWGRSSLLQTPMFPPFSPLLVEN